MLEQYELISYKDRSIRVVIEHDDLLDGWQLKDILENGVSVYEQYSIYERRKILDAAIEQNKFENQY